MTTAALGTIEARHEAFRRDVEAFRETVWNLDIASSRSGDGLAAWFEAFWALLQHQYRHEERAALRLVEEKTASGAALFRAFHGEHAALEALSVAILEALRDYARVDSRVDRVVWRGSLCVRVTRFEELLRAHLDRKERELLPLLRRHLAEEEVRALERHAQRSAPLRLLGVLVPWLLQRVVAGDEAQALRRLPWAWRLLYQWRWKKTYLRLAQPVLRHQIASA